MRSNAERWYDEARAEALALVDRGLAGAAGLEDLPSLPEYRPDQSRYGFRPRYEDPAYGELMLAVQLDPRSDQGCWRPDRIAEQVNWIERQIGPLAGLGIADVGCGPGLWARALASVGVTCYTGIDLNPAAIAHARQAQGWPGGFRFLEGDVLADWERSGRQHDLVVLAYETINAFSDDEIGRLLTSVAKSMRPGAALVGDVRTWDAEAASVVAGRQVHWRPRGSSLHPGPHMVLDEFGCCATPFVSGHRFCVFPGDGDAPFVMNSFLRLYREHDLASLLEDAGFRITVLDRPFDFRPTDAEESATNLFFVARRLGG